MPPRKSTRKPNTAADKPYTDFIQPFLIDHSAIRGRLVRLSTVLDKILSAHAYSGAVARHLAEQIVLSALLSATLSEDGILTVQAKGSGPVSFTVVDVMAGGVIRGYAKVDEEALAKALKASKDEYLPLSAVMGKGYLAVTLDQGPSKQRYQGIVELQGDNLSEVFKGYFVQSQQGEIEIHVSIQPPAKGRKQWKAGGIIIERMPAQGGKEPQFSPQEQDDLWQRTRLFMRTLKDTEMLDTAITPQNLLYRLFGEDGVWVYKLQPLKQGCRCSRERVKAVLRSIAEAELMDALDGQGKLSVHCEFCNKRQIFTRADISRLYRQPTKKKAK